MSLFHLLAVVVSTYQCEKQSPIFTLLESPESPGLQAKSYLANDPALIVLYRQLREKTLQTLKGASMIPPEAEWEFIMQNARLYDRMGCDLLALDLGESRAPWTDNSRADTGSSA